MYMLTFSHLVRILDWNWISPEADVRILSIFSLTPHFLPLFGMQFVRCDEGIPKNKGVVKDYVHKLLRMNWASLKPGLYVLRKYKKKGISDRVE